MTKGSKTASKIAGKTKGAVKALEGYPGIFHHLAGEHAEVSTLMKRIAGASNGSDARRELYPELRTNLLAHAHGEESEFYPPLQQWRELEPLVQQCLDEHRAIEAQLDELDALDIDSDAWRDKFGSIMQAVESHVEVEEKQLFPKARDLLDNQQASEMERNYENVEAQEKDRLRSYAIPR